MRSLYPFLLLLACAVLISCEKPDELSMAFPYDLLDSDPEAAYELALDLREKSEKSDHLQGLVDYNYILGYIQQEEGDDSKAIFHYLEGIFYGEEAPDRYAEQLIAMYKGSGIIYGKFKHYPLAEGAYLRGIELATNSGNTTEKISLNYNLSIVYRDMEKYDRSIDILQQILPLTETDSRKYFDILNSLAIRYRNAGQHDQAISFSNRLLQELPEDNFKMRGYVLHGLAKTYRTLEDPDQAIANYKKAIAEKSKTDVIAADLFSSLQGIGEVYMEQGQLDLAEGYFSRAEALISKMMFMPSYFELYDFQSTLFMLKGDTDQAVRYNDLHSSCRKRHTAEMEEIEANDKRFNMELVTRQFQHHMAEKERKARNRTLLFIVCIVSAVLIMGLVILIIRERNKQKAIRRKIREANKELMKM